MGVLGIMRTIDVGDAIYIVESVKINGFPEGILLKFNYPTGCP